MPHSALGDARAGAGRRLIMWRHGRTSWNATGRFQGQVDVDLDDTGRAQAHAAGRRLASLRPDLVLTSDLRRAADTAQVLARLCGAPVQVDPRLRETHLGDWQGLTLEEVRASFPGEVEAWSRGESVRRGGGEAEDAVAARVAAAVGDALRGSVPGATVVVVSHGSALRVGIGGLLGLDQAHWKALGALSNCRWSVLAENGPSWRLAEHNAGSLPEQVLGDDA